MYFVGYTLSSCYQQDNSCLVTLSVHLNATKKICECFNADISYQEEHSSFPAVNYVQRNLPLMGAHVCSDARLSEPTVPFNTASHGELHLAAQVHSTFPNAFQDVVVKLIASTSISQL